MSGEFKGCASVIRSLYPHAVYVHCSNHSLNLAVANCCKITYIRNCIGTIKDVVNLFRLSTKSGAILKKCIQKSYPTAKQTRLLKFCETRWVEHLDSLSLFSDVFPCICEALEEIDDRNVRFDLTKPHALLAAVRTPQFIIALGVLKPVFALSKNISEILQQEQCDLSSCIIFIDDLFAEVNEMRINAEESFKAIFNSAKEIGAELGIELKVPRVVARQVNRENYEGCPETYYRCSIFVPFLDHFLDQLEERFLKHRDLLAKIQNILPHKCKILNEMQMEETVRTLEMQWPDDIQNSTDNFLAELKLWRRRNLQQSEKCNTFIKCLNFCDRLIFPTIYRFLQIGATLPVSVASSERSFSTLRRLKTYIRNKTGQDRLNGLALLNVHRDISITEEEIIDVLAKKNRKLIL